MGLSASLQIGRTALAASQLAIQVTGNNFANASTPGYSRQIVDLTAYADTRFGKFQIGRGVDIAGIRRQTDAALQNRLFSGYSQQGSANIDRQVLATVETTLDDLGDTGLSTQLNEFFDAWSELSNSANRDGARALVVSQGRSLAGSIRALRTDLQAIQRQNDQQIDSHVTEANRLLQQITDLNVQIVNTAGGADAANTLRDQRDLLVGQLSQYVEVCVVEQPSGGINVTIGSTPVILESVNKGIEVQRNYVNGEEVVTLNVRADSTELHPAAGSIEALLRQRTGAAGDTIDKLDEVAAQLIFQVNRLHSVGSPQTPFSSASGTLKFGTADQTLAFNDPNNRTIDDLPYAPVNGGFLVTVKNTSTGASQTVRIRVDLDGITSSGAAGTTDDTNLTSLTSDIDAIANLSAVIQPDGSLKIDAATGYSVSFGEDTSGVLAVLGINTYFVGTDATSIDVRSELKASPSLLATGLVTAGAPVDNGTALAIAALRDTRLSEFGGESILGAWRNQAQQIGSLSAAAGTRADAAAIVSGNLEAQRAAVSGVDLDEESINLLNYQRMYQGAARFISVVDDLTQTLLGLVG